MSENVTQRTYLISRLEEALEIQEETEGEICKNPTVSYCFDCDVIGVDMWSPEGCLDHHTVSSDGYETAGIQSAITTLEALED